MCLNIEYFTDISDLPEVKNVFTYKKTVLYVVSYSMLLRIPKNSFLFQIEKKVLTTSNYMDTKMGKN